jgi:hypothetical protein
MDSERLTRWLRLGANIAVLIGIALLIYWCRARTYYSPEFAADMDSLLPDNACVN